MLYILTNVWVLSTPHDGQDMIFSHFCMKSVKNKEQIEGEISQTGAKKHIFKYKKSH